MKKYLTNEYSESLVKLKGGRLFECEIHVNKASLAKNYLKRYEKSPYGLIGFDGGELIMEISNSNKQNPRLLVFHNQKTIDKILEEFNINYARELEDKTLIGLGQYNKIVGIAN